MIKDVFEVGVIVVRRRLTSPWADYAWLPEAVLAGVPSAEPWTVLEEAASATRFYAGALRLEFCSTETGFYRENLRSGRPSLWVSLRRTGRPPGVVPHRVTADPAEGEALTEVGSDIVEAVPMPSAIRDHLAAFVEAHHVERPFVKRKRDRADPEALAKRPGRAAGVWSKP